MVMRMFIGALALLAGGCAATPTSRGWVTQAEVGKPFPDFAFQDDQGVQRSLKNLASDFTVLAFTRCDLDTHGPTSALLQEMVAENGRESFVRVVGVDVHWFDGRCDHGGCHLVREHRNLSSICDATGSIHRRYGVGDEDMLLIIGPKFTIIAAAPASEASALRASLRAEVRAQSEETALKYSRDIG